MSFRLDPEPPVRRRIKPVDHALFWRCAAACQAASRNFPLSDVERGVLDGMIEHYRAGMAVDDAIARAAITIIEKFNRRRASRLSEAEIARQLRAMRRGRRKRRLSGSGKAAVLPPG